MKAGMPFAAMMNALIFGAVNDAVTQQRDYRTHSTETLRFGRRGPTRLEIRSARNKKAHKLGRRNHRR